MKAAKALVLTAAIVALFSCGNRSWAQQGPYLEIDPTYHAPASSLAQIIEIPPDDTETFWAHIGWAGNEGRPLHIDEVSWHAEITPPNGAVTEVIQWLAQPSQVIVVSEWFPWNVVHTVGVPSTLITFQADIVLSDGQGGVWGPIWSNVVTKHITPEPSSLLAMGTGVLGMGGLLLRRRKSS
ncbi:MAG: PEP-CTERM sorting domain-containing protein [Armatimonadetes bacterium]|nr:PEP-CTERM sorting domain-containing protein [Armatimonadota bacterium]